MRAVSLIKGILLNICSMVCIALKVLDWYNPYMDFAGHAVFIPYTLYISVFPMQFWKHFPAETDTKTEEKNTGCCWSQAIYRTECYWARSER